jgi:hypothetical protein
MIVFQAIDTLLNSVIKGSCCVFLVLPIILPLFRKGFNLHVRSRLRYFASLEANAHDLFVINRNERMQLHVYTLYVTSKTLGLCFL